MHDVDLDKAMSVAQAAVREAGKKLKEAYGKVEMLTKGGDAASGVVTELDRSTEKFLAVELGKFSDKIGFQGEEYGVQTEGDMTWLVDPIDGTAHFIRGLPFCTTMVALIDRGQVVLSVIYDFVRDDMYSAIKGQGSYCNDKKLSVSNHPLSKSIISFETNLGNSSNLEKFLSVRKRAIIMATINCGFEFAMIASGKLDGRIALQPYGRDYDFAPGSLLVAEAGGVVVNIGSDNYDYRNLDYIISNQEVYRDLVSGVEPLLS